MYATEDQNHADVNTGHAYVLNTHAPGAGAYCIEHDAFGS